MRLRQLRQWLPGLLIWGLTSGGAVFAQGLGPAAFGLPARFGMGTPSSVRQLGLGSVMGTLCDDLCSNPAFLPQQERAQAGTRMTVTDLEHGPEITSYLSHVVYPLRPGRDGLQLMAVNVDSADGSLTLPGGMPAAVEMSEDAYVLDYGWRVNEKVTAGLGILGYESAELVMRAPLGPALLDLQECTGLGLRVGLSHEYRPGDFGGLLYSYAENRVDASGALLPLSQRVRYHSHQVALGLTHHFRPAVVGVAEYTYGTARSGLGDSSANSWRFGLEWTLGRALALRAGLADGNFTGGLGYQSERFSLGYAYLKDWNNDEVGQLFGGSDTHAVEAVTTW